jgi:hypothetical protein
VECVEIIEQISEIQAHVHGMREVHLEESSVMPDEFSITRLEAKKKVHWYLGLLAAAVAGAHRHMSNFEQDEIFSATEKELVQLHIIDRLHQELKWLPANRNSGVNRRFLALHPSLVVPHLLLRYFHKMRLCPNITLNSAPHEHHFSEERPIIKQIGKFGTIRRELDGKACPFCQGQEYQLVLRR